MTFKLEVAAVNPDFKITNGYMMANGTRIDPGGPLDPRIVVEPNVALSYTVTVENVGGGGSVDAKLMIQESTWGRDEWNPVSGSDTTKYIGAQASETIIKTNAATMPSEGKWNYKIWVGIGSNMHDELGCGELESEEGKFGL